MLGIIEVLRDSIEVAAYIALTFSMVAFAIQSFILFVRGPKHDA